MNLEDIIELVVQEAKQYKTAQVDAITIDDMKKAAQLEQLLYFEISKGLLY